MQGDDVAQSVFFCKDAYLIWMADLIVYACCFYSYYGGGGGIIPPEKQPIVVMPNTEPMPAWRDRSIAGPMLRLVELSAFVERQPDEVV